VALVRVYCGVAAADVASWLTVAVVDDAGRLLELREFCDDPTGYASLGALLANRSSGPVPVALDSPGHLVAQLLAASDRPLAIPDDATVADFAERFRDTDSYDESRMNVTQRRAIGLARALQAGVLSAMAQSPSWNMEEFKPVLAAHAAIAGGRQAAAAALREILRELYPAALRAYPDPAEAVPLKILEALPEPGLLTSSPSSRSRDASLIAELASTGVADTNTAVAAITALRAAVAEAPRWNTSRMLAPVVAETVRQSVAAVRACDAASAALIATLVERLGAPATAAPSPFLTSASAPVSPAPRRATGPAAEVPPSRLAPRSSAASAAATGAMPPVTPGAMPPMGDGVMAGSSMAGSSMAGSSMAAAMGGVMAGSSMAAAVGGAMAAAASGRDADGFMSVGHSGSIPAPRSAPTDWSAPVSPPMAPWSDEPPTWGGQPTPAAPPTWGGHPAAEPVTWGGQPMPAEPVTWGGQPMPAEPVTWGGQQPMPPEPPAWGGQPAAAEPPPVWSPPPPVPPRHAPPPPPPPPPPPSPAPRHAEPVDWADPPSASSYYAQTDPATATTLSFSMDPLNAPLPPPPPPPGRPWTVDGLSVDPPALHRPPPPPPPPDPLTDPLTANGAYYQPERPDGDLLIFSQTPKSAWFSLPEDLDLRDDTPHWSSGLNDDGWRAAEQVAWPTVGADTHAGLPRRVPQANLVPGSASEDEPHVRIVRDAESIAAHTSGYFRGWRRGQEIGGYAVGQRDRAAWEFNRDQRARDGMDQPARLSR
jgi:hypothetical protein